MRKRLVKQDKFQKRPGKLKVMLVKQDKF